MTSRVDVQVVLDQTLATRPDTKVHGIYSPMNQEPPSLAQLFARSPFPMELAPLHLSFAVLLVPAMRYGQAGGVLVEIAVPTGEAGA